MLNRWNTSIPVLCVSSLLLVGGCGDNQSASSTSGSDVSVQTTQTAQQEQSNESTRAADSSADASSMTAAGLSDSASGVRSELDATRSTRGQDMSLSTRPAADTGAVVVVAEPAVLDLGEMPTGETVRGTVKLRNTGDRPMTVMDSRTSCGCTVANVPKGEQIQPGEAVEVEVSLRGGMRPEHLSKVVTFMVEGQPPITVRVEGRTVAYVVVEPAMFEFNSEGENQLTVRAEDGEPFSITSVTPRIIDELPTESKVEHVLDLSMDRWEEIGQPRRVLLSLDHPKVSRLSTSIRVPTDHQHLGRTADDIVLDQRVAPRLTPDILVSQGRTEEVLQRLNDGEISVTATDRGGLTLLALSAKHGNVDLIRAFIDAGADIEARDTAGRTPLMYAAQSKNALAVRVLLEAGADVDARDTSLANSALSWAAGFGDAASVRELLDAGASVEVVTNATGFTPLIMAAGFGEADSVRHLIEAGANIEVVDTLQGYTPLMYAASTGKTENIQALLEGGANLEATEPSGRTVLLVAAAAAGAKAETIQALIDAGADVTAVDRLNRNALDLAKGRTDLRRDEVVAVLEQVLGSSDE